MQRYLITLSYHGVCFAGSQKQPDVKTVYGLLEDALRNVFKQTTPCIPCGRTDTGVHALRSYCHFDIQFNFNISSVMHSLNSFLLTHGVFVHKIELVSADFHSLSSAYSRTYHYYFSTDVLPNYMYHSVTFLNRPLRFIPSQKELNILNGQRNFFSLCNPSSDAKTFIRNIYFTDITKQDYEALTGQFSTIYCFKITANGFLYKMVRHIVGLLLHSMLNFTNMYRLNDYLIINRPVGYTLAPVQGLHLAEVNYNNDTKVVME